MSFRLLTERLYLRELKPSDAKNLYDLNADPEVILYTGDKAFDSIYQAHQFLEDYKVYNEYGYGRWAIINKSTTDFIGWCGFKYHQEGYVDLGFRIHKKYWNRGYATEASMACIEFGFDKLGFKEIVGRTSENNIASVKVLEKLGFTFWKKDECDGIEDARYYSLKKVMA